MALCSNKLFVLFSSWSGYSSSILLDGSGSYNPDNPSDPTGGLRYAWYCSKVDDINQDNQEQGAQYLVSSVFICC